MDDPGANHLRLVESCELLSVGVSGKIALWNALAGCRDSIRAFATLHYSHLLAMAHGQHESVKSIRINVARHAFI